VTIGFISFGLLNALLSITLQISNWLLGFHTVSSLALYEACVDWKNSQFDFFFILEKKNLQKSANSSRLASLADHVTQNYINAPFAKEMSRC
jgi:hypothetical protein